jgi:hypothetical protein
VKDQKDVLGRLRDMIRDMERARGSGDGSPVFPQLPPVPRIGPGSCVLRDVSPASVDTTEGERLRIIQAAYPSGTVPELLRIPAGVFQAFRSLEPDLESVDGWLFLDIETTGLAGAATVAFLVGLGEWTGDSFQVTQLFLKDRSGEEFLLDEVAKRLSGRPVTVTFNGKAFDLPVLRGRFAMNGMRPPVFSRVHLDLLSLVRNMGRRPEYGQSLREAIRRFTGAARDGDIPGHLIPALYFVYERDGDASVLEPVMRHNRLDVLDMACLSWVFGHVLSGELDAGDAAALGGAGKLHLRKGNLSLARRCLETALSDLPGESGRGPAGVGSLRLLGHVLRKQGDWKAARDAWERVVCSGEARDEDYLWLARCYEVSSGDIQRSLEVVDRAVSLHESLGHEPPPALLGRKRRLGRLSSAAKRVIPPILPS